MKWFFSILEGIIYCITNPHLWLIQLLPECNSSLLSLSRAPNPMEPAGSWCISFFFLSLIFKKRKRRQHVSQIMRVESWSHEFLLNFSNKENLGANLERKLHWQKSRDYEKTVRILSLAFLPVSLFTSFLSPFLSSFLFHFSLPVNIK